MISLGLSIDEPETASASVEDDDLPALEPASASAMEEVSFPFFSQFPSFLGGDGY